MRLAKDPQKDYKAIVEQGYDACSAAYDEARQNANAPELDLLIPRLAVGAQVLDIGCGAGVPVAQRLVKQFKVTGVDISAEQVKRAKDNVPQGTFMQMDIMAADFPSASFDAIVAFYSIFHLPREEHAALLRKIKDWLKPGGYLLATLSSDPESAYTEEDFFGVKMYWSNLELGKYHALLKEMGFELLDASVIGHGFGKGAPAADESHPLVFARKSDGQWGDH